jgi:glycosyltransferase involved in cell wall biosynthesis
MRILIATDQWFPDVLGGAARVATETACRLAARGHEVTVLAPRHVGMPSRESHGSLTIERALTRGRLPQTFADPVGARRFARRRGSRTFDVLVAHQATLAAGLLAARPRTPLVLVFHASARRELRFLRREQRWPGRLASGALHPALVALERVSLARADRVLVLSEFSEQLALADNARVAPLLRRVRGGVGDEWLVTGNRPEARRTLGVGTGEEIILSVRRFEPRMGLEQLLRAFARLTERRSCRLVLGGDGMLASRLRSLAGELGLGDRVAFLGRVPDGELRRWLLAADVFVLPTVAYEGFGMATVEALACGTPVVGTPVGATPELLAPLEPSLVAASTEPEDLAATIELTLAAAGNGLRERCRAYAADRFSWNVVLDEWEEALQDAGDPDPTSPAEHAVSGPLHRRLAARP